MRFKSSQLAKKVRSYPEGERTFFVHLRGSTVCSPQQPRLDFLVRGSAEKRDMKSRIGKKKKLAEASPSLTVFLTHANRFG